jgi:kinesin family protein C1
MNDYGIRTPNKSSMDFSVNSTCSSVKKSLFHGNNDRVSNYASSTSTSSYCGEEFMMQAKIEHLEKERVELTMQLHKRDEKDRDRKLKLEQVEYRLKASEEERQRAVLEAAENREQVVRAKFEADELRAEIVRLQQEIQNTNRVEAMDVWKKMTTASRALKKAEDDLAASNAAKDAVTQQMAELTVQINIFRDQNGDLERQLEETKANVEILLQKNQKIPFLETETTALQQALEADRNQFQKSINSLQEELETANRQKEQLQEELQNALEQAKNMVTIVSQEENPDDIAHLRKQLFESESKRRKLHNQLQDLKGNIRVFLRCRPFLSADGDEVYQSKQTNLILHDDKTSVTVLNAATLGMTGAKPTHQFAFDHVFTPEARQHEVYKEVSDLVQSVLDGYRVCVFSYGQTGSGKTHTMSGNRHGDERGIIPRSIEELLRNAHTLQSQGWEVELSVSIVEIYNEEIRDLLANAKPTPQSINNNNNPSREKENSEKIKIGRQNGRVVVSGLTTIPIHVGAVETSATSYDDSCAMQQFYDVFNQSMRTRSTASTGMNEVSSRSHLIVMVDVAASLTTVAQGTSTMTLTGGLRLCDLAGSERLDRTNTLHDSTRLRETVNINKSLSCLADVFLALQNKAPHVPYRNSKLTMLLQDCLSGDGKALMFVNVSPTVASSAETLCSLRFAAQVNSVELGKAQKHSQTTTVITQTASASSAPTSMARSTNPPEANAANYAAQTTRSRRMSVMSGMATAPSARTNAPQSASSQPQVAAASMAEVNISAEFTEETHLPRPILMTDAKEGKSVRFDGQEDVVEPAASGPLSTVKPFSADRSSLMASTTTSSSLASSNAAASTLSSAAAARSAARPLPAAGVRRTSSIQSLSSFSHVSMPPTLVSVPPAALSAMVSTITSSNSSILSSSLLSAAKASKGSTDASLLFSSGGSSSSFVINAASLSSSSSTTSSSSSATMVSNKENVDQPQYNSMVGSSSSSMCSGSSNIITSSALLSGAKRDASSALHLESVVVHANLNNHHPHHPHHQTLSMPAKRLRPTTSASASEGWSSLGQPAQRKSTWR